MQFDFSGGALCLDFANTVSDHATGRTERLRDYPDLVEWGRQAGTLSATEARRLRRRAKDEPARASDVLREAISLRSSIYRIFRNPTKDSIDRLNDVLATSMCFARVNRRKEDFVWGWKAPEDRLDPMLWPVARSAADLLTSDEHSRVHECDLETCTWLFLDRSRAGKRRWCDMKSCGNRAKARRHYARAKASRVRSKP